MNVAMFIVGVLIFSIFLVSIVWEIKTEKKASTENYLFLRKIFIHKL